MTKVVFTPSAEQKKIIEGLPKDDRNAFNALTDEDKINTLKLMGAFAVDVKTSVEFVSSDAMSDRLNHTVFAIGSALGPFRGATEKAPVSKSFRFIGTVPMFSLEEKENWVENDHEGRKFWTQAYYLLETLDEAKDRFGIYETSMLRRILPKIPTRESLPTVDRNPEIRLTHYGVVEGKEHLKKEYKLELKKGNKAHVTLVDIEDGHKVERYIQGCINYLRNPLPNLGTADGDRLKGIALADSNWKKMEQLRGNVSQTVLDGPPAGAGLEAPRA